MKRSKISDNGSITCLKKPNIIDGNDLEYSKIIISRKLKITKVAKTTKIKKFIEVNCLILLVRGNQKFA